MHEPAPAPLPPSTWEHLVDAPHEAFRLDANGRIFAATAPAEKQLELGSLSRGASLLHPEVKLAPLDELPAGTKSQLQRRLLAFARDTVSRLLEPIAELKHAESAPLRAMLARAGHVLVAGKAARIDLADATASEDSH